LHTHCPKGLHCPALKRTIATATNLGGISIWYVGDMAVKSASGWIKIANQDISAIWGNITGNILNQTDLQNQFGTKQNTITGAATSITGNNLTINRALISDALGKVAVSPVSSTELSYLTGATSNIQTQINSKLNTSIFTGYTASTASNEIYLNSQIQYTKNADIKSKTNSNYSIIKWADYIKKSESGFQYMIDAYTRNSYGGVWTANAAYSFISTSNANTNITLNTNYGGWSYNTNNDGVSERMPWYGYVGSNTGFYSLASGSGNWWGTLIANNQYYAPAPWIGTLGGYAANPGIIWYWVR
jgi:hypothetical protein